MYRLFASFPTPFATCCSVFFCCYYYTCILLWWFNNTNKKEQRAKVDGMVGFSFNLMVVGYRGKIRFLAWIFNKKKMNWTPTDRTLKKCIFPWEPIFKLRSYCIHWMSSFFVLHSLMNGISLIIRFYALLIRSCSVLVRHVKKNVDASQILKRINWRVYIRTHCIMYGWQLDHSVVKVRPHHRFQSERNNTVSYHITFYSSIFRKTSKEERNELVIFDSRAEFL